jgi:hypothetical protein
MDSHESTHDKMLEAFLAGDLGAAGVNQWDEHLLGCEQCWRAVREDRNARRAVQVLRQPAPAWLADKVSFAVQVAAASPGARAPGRRLPSRAKLALASIATAAFIAVSVLTHGLIGAGRVGARQAANPPLPTAVAMVTHYAEALPARPQSGGTAERLQLELVRRQIAVLPDGQRITIATWRVDGLTAVVATADRFFPMPRDAHLVSGPGMAWSAQFGTLSLYCANGRPSELVAARAPESTLVTLVATLPV